MPEVYLGLDYSRRKIGVATGQNLTYSATALTTLVALQQQPDWQGLNALIEQWKPAALIIGLPLNMDGTEQDTTHSAREFGMDCQQRFNLPVFFVDERLSSREASHMLGYEGITSPRRINRPGKKNKKHNDDTKIDSMAAELILQSWLNEQKSS